MNIKRKAWALQNYSVPGLINCVALGRKSGRVMATGGLNNKVNLWVVGKSTCIMVLSDHNSPIQSVSFDPEENKVAAGSASGSIKVWELDESKEVRSLPGHKSSVSTINFYPFGNIISSGGLDCNMKLWDIRKKSCINTYKGHSGPINCLRFSPDGKWLVSGSNDNLIKLWDLTAGKQIAEFPDHRAAITAIEFHPQLLILSSSSKDHTIKMFDLQDFKLIESTLRTDSASSIDKLCFHPHESILYAASNDYLKIYMPEPLNHLESVYVGWQNGFNDMALTPDYNQMIGVSATQSNLTTYVVDINSCAPFVSVDQSGSKYGNDRPYTSTSSVNRKSFCVDQNVNQDYFPKEHQKLNLKPPNELQQEKASIEIQDQEEFDKIFNKSNRMPRSPPFDNQRNFGAEFTDIRKSVINNNSPIAQNKDPKIDSALNNIPRFNYPEPVIQQESPNKQNLPRKESKNNLQEQKPEPVASAGDESFTDEDIIQKLQLIHKNVAGVLHYRQKYLTHIRNSWTPHNISIAIDAAVKIDDKAVFVDLLSILNQNNHLFTLDTALLLMPQLYQLTTSKYDSYVDSACQILKIILKSFSTLIKQNLSCPPSYVDISREERFKKCSCCYEYLVKIRDTLSKRPVTKPIPLLNEVLILLNLLQSE